MYIISDQVYAFLEEEGVYMLIRVGKDLEKVYRDMDRHPSGRYGLVLASEDQLPFVESFLFLPSYLRTYLAGEIVKTHFDSPEALVLHYPTLLRSGEPCGNDLFVEVASPDLTATLIRSLQTIEKEFEQDFPSAYALMQRNTLLQREIDRLSALQQSTAAELSHQQQFVEVLRSSHKILELQDYYTHEYEILPLWYKRFGHILKVLTGKRRFRSLFDNNAKKYKD